MQKQNPDTSSTTRWTRFAAFGGLIVASAALLAAGTASARHQGPFAGGQFPITIADVETRMQERFNTVDEDGSGDINLDEFLAADGPDRKHHRKRHWRQAGAQAADREALKTAMEDTLFSLLDSNGDGSISDAEFKDSDKRQLRKQARRQVMFTHLDADGNGTLSIGEMPNPAARLQQADSNADGQISREEMRAARKAHRESQDG